MASLQEEKFVFQQQLDQMRVQRMLRRRISSTGSGLRDTGIQIP